MSINGIGGAHLPPAEVWFFPYLSGLRDREQVGGWTLIPEQVLEPADCLGGPLFGYVEGLARLYERPDGAGVFVRPTGGHIGNGVDHDDVWQLRRAVCIAALAWNPAIDVVDDDHSNLGHRIVTSDSTVLYGHPFSPEGGITTIRGALVRRRDIGIRSADDTMSIPSPDELPHALLGGSFDAEYAHAVLSVLRTRDDRLEREPAHDHVEDGDQRREQDEEHDNGDEQEHRHDEEHADVEGANEAGELAGRLARAADWLDVVWRNTESITGDTRILAVHAGLEALVAPVGESSRIEIFRANVGALLDPPDAPRESRKYLTLKRKPVTEEMTDREWWAHRFQTLRTRLAHGVRPTVDDYHHEGRHHFPAGEETMRSCIRELVVKATGQELLRIEPLQRTLYG